MQRLHNQAYDALLSHQAEHVERTDRLVATLHGVTLAYRTEGSAEQRLSAIGAWIEPDADRILEQCEAHEATAGRNYLPFLGRFYSHQRQADRNTCPFVMNETKKRRSTPRSISHL